MYEEYKYDGNMSDRMTKVFTMKVRMVSTDMINKCGECNRCTGMMEISMMKLCRMKIGSDENICDDKIYDEN